MVTSNPIERTNPSDEIKKLLDHIEQDKLKEYCTKVLGIPSDLYDSHLVYPFANLFDSLSEIADELHTEELLAMEEEEFLDDMEEDFF